MGSIDERLRNGEIILLDGATGSELQARGVPMDHASWSGKALKTHPDTVREIHEDYIRAGADIVTANSFSSARPALADAGLGDETRELNALAVKLAQEARDNVAVDRPVYVAGSMSTYGGTMATKVPSLSAADDGKDFYHEQADILAEAGAELLVLEMMTDIEQATLCTQAALSTGLPVWIGFTIQRAESGDLIMDEIEKNIPFAKCLDALLSLGGSAVTVMHSEIENTAPGLEIVKERWDGSLGAYPNLGTWKRPEWVFDNPVSPEDYLEHCKTWVEMGVQIIGGCCGTGLEHIATLAEQLPRPVLS